MDGLLDAHRVLVARDQRLVVGKLRRGDQVPRHTYGGSSLRTHPPYTRSARIAVVHMHVMGTGVIPACRDTNHSTDQDRPVPVARIDGVDPGLAVATYPDGAVYVNALTSGVINKVLKSARGIRWR